MCALWAWAGGCACAPLCTSGGTGGRGWALPALLHTVCIPIRWQDFSLKNGHQVSPLSGKEHMKGGEARPVCDIKTKKNKRAVLMETVSGNVPREGASVTIGGTSWGGSRAAPSRVPKGAGAMNHEVLPLDKILRMK